MSDLSNIGPLPTSDGHRDRHDARLLLRAMVKGWPVTPEIRERAMRWANSVLDEANTEATQNDKDRAVKAVQEADKINTRIIELADKISRLDDPNGATERVHEIKRVILEGD